MNGSGRSVASHAFDRQYAAGLEAEGKLRKVGDAWLMALGGPGVERDAESHGGRVRGRVDGNVLIVEFRDLSSVVMSSVTADVRRLPDARREPRLDAPPRPFPTVIESTAVEIHHEDIESAMARAVAEQVAASRRLEEPCPREIDAKLAEEFRLALPALEEIVARIRPSA